MNAITPLRHTSPAQSAYLRESLRASNAQGELVVAAERRCRCPCHLHREEARQAYRNLRDTLASLLGAAKSLSEEQP